MKIKLKFLLIIGILIILFIIGNLAIKHKLMTNRIAFVGPNKSITLYDTLTKQTSTMSINGFANFQVLGKYLGGDFCCTSVDDNFVTHILFIKDNNVEKSFSLDYQPSEIIANNQELYCLVNDIIYCVDINTQQSKIYAKDVYSSNLSLNMFLSEDGKLLFSIATDNTEIIKLAYISENNTTILSEMKYAEGFISSTEFLYKDINYDTKKVDINNGTVSNATLYRKCNNVILSNDGNRFASFYATGESGGFGVLKITNAHYKFGYITTLDNFSVPLSFVLMK